MDAQFTGKQITKLRKQLGMTQRELAEKLYVTDKAVSKWERGINFPDLGLLENLAAALDTTPACLLGLENADQSETLKTLAEISREQLAEAKRDLRIFSWGSVAVALLLCLIYHLTQKGTVEVYYLLHSMITVIGIPGLGYLFKYGEIKKWEPAELATFGAAALPVMICMGYHFLTGYSLSPTVTWILISAASVFVQIHFLQVMKPRLMQLLPLLLSALYGLWQLIFGGVEYQELVPLGCCLAVCFIDWRENPQKRKINRKALSIGICMVLLVVFFVCIACYPSLVRTYVVSNRDRLENYAEDRLEAGNSDTFGLWDVDAYPELGVVQFRTGGSGLAPGSIYEGFYYAASGEHTAFPGFAFSESYGPDAWFRDPAENSDNWQKSTQIAPNWFWFELHY